MRVRALIAAAGVCAAACSKPDTSISTSKDQGRDLRLGSSLASDTTVVSDLEAGRTPKPRIAAPVDSRKVETRQAKRAETALAAAVLAKPKLSTTTATAVAEAPRAALVVASAPMAESQGNPSLVLGGGYGIATQPDGFGGRSRPVILRGGIGGPDDDCDIRHPHNMGMAVNRSSAAPGNPASRGVHW